MKRSYNHVIGENGWIRLYSQPKRFEFWVDGYPVIEDANERMRYGIGSTGRRSPIIEAGNGEGIGTTQWINYSLNRAAILVPIGSWKIGGDYKLWMSTGIGTTPHEVDLLSKVEIVEGDNDGWRDTLEEARTQVDFMLQFRAVPEIS